MLPEEEGEQGFSLRALVIALSLSLFLLASSSYIALKLGALPWPIIFSVIASGGILKLLSRLRSTTMHEINVAQAGGTIGGMLASGVVFTIPGIIYLQRYENVDIAIPDLWILALICVFGALLGVLLSIPLRRTFIDEESLPFPSGAAGAEVLKAEMIGGRSAILLFIVGIVTAIFALTRDLYFASGFTLTFLTTYGIIFTLYPMPMGIGIGYILGPKISINSWLSGAIVGWVFLVPLLDNYEAFNLVQELGMGIVLGSGIGFFVAYVAPKAKKIFLPLFSWKKAPWYTRIIPFVSVISFGALILSGVPIIASIIAVGGVWIMATVASRMTGETNIDPLEQFGIIIGLLSLGLYSVLTMDLGYLPAFLIVCFVSIAAALAGDIGHDYKSAKIIGTRPKDIIKVDLICAAVSGLFAPVILKIILEGYSSDLFTQAMPAPQAVLVARSIFGFTYPEVFYIGVGLAFAVEIGRRLIKKEIPLSLMAFGIGMFLGLTLAFLLAIGGVIRHITDRKGIDYRKGVLVSAGLMGGEGIAGFLAAFLIVMGIGAAVALKGLIGAALALLVVILVWYKVKK
jgi:uncharacterized oligopeptide transporter (OPT) family protein